MKNAFNSLTFDDKKIEELVGKDALETICNARKTGSPIDKETIEKIASALGKWAIQNGATHYTHWFHPIAGSAAEKLLPLTILSQYGSSFFNAKNLLNGESDGSAYPSGGLRTTFEARGLSHWDYYSPAFLKHIGSRVVLFIPTLFSSPSGEALDKKTPLLKSERALIKEASKLLEAMGEKCDEIIDFVGVEQEFFLIDKDKADKREDISVLGRTVIGSENKDLQFNSHHYASGLGGRAAVFYSLLNEKLHDLGIVPCAEHKEVSPNQFEVALAYTKSNITLDHNQILMDLIISTADKLNLTVLFDEKPFKGVNGSGKHTNWSVSNGCDNLFKCGKNGENSLRFLLMIALFIRSMDKYSSLILSSIVSRSNEFRLGKQEAPPLVLSVFLGSGLTSILEKTEDELLDFKITKEVGNSDRNRTSPIAFTGNKFEFRAVGSSQSISSPVTFINTAFAESLKYAHERINSASDKKREIVKIIKDCYNNHKRIIYNGNCYSDEWKKEYKNRSLIAESDILKCIEKIGDEKNVELLTSFGVMTNNEIASRINIYKENYMRTIVLEGNIALEILSKHIIPSGYKELRQKADPLSYLSLDDKNAECFKKEHDGISDLLCELIIYRDKLRNDVKNKRISSIKNDLNKVLVLADDLMSRVSSENSTLPSYDDLLIEI